MRDWVKPGGTSLNVEHIRERYGSSEVTVHDCGSGPVRGSVPCKPALLGQGYFPTIIIFTDLQQRVFSPAPHCLENHSFDPLPFAIAPPRELQPPPDDDMACASGMETLPSEVMRVDEYLDRWQHRSADDLLYLKDWNFAKEHGGHLLYDNPPHFREDWLNDYESTHASDHRFVYIGTKGTFTPLHRDTLCSFSWSANIMGSKQWWMMPPEVEEALHNDEGCQVFDVRHVDEARFPRAGKALGKMLTFTQGPREIVFVPSSWWHQVLNKTDALSINHNWVHTSLPLPSFPPSLISLFLHPVPSLHLPLPLPLHPSPLLSFSTGLSLPRSVSHPPTLPPSLLSRLSLCLAPGALRGHISFQVN
jgi:hypothetical protein